MDLSFICKFKKPGAMHHARFIAKVIYYMKILLLKDFVQNHIDLDSALITRMGKFIAIFYAPEFLTNEKPDIALLQVFKQSTSIKFKYKFTITKFHAITVNLKSYKNISFFLYQDLNSVWKMSRYVENEPAASAVFKSWGNHSWYLDPTFVPIVLANSDDSVTEQEKERIAKKLYNIPIPNDYDMDRHNNKGFLPKIKDMSVLDKRPELVDFFTAESWLIFEILGHNKTKSKWMIYPASSWNIDSDYLEFQSYVKNLAVVNDCSERAVKLVQETVCQVKSEHKLQKLLKFKNNWTVKSSKTKAAYRKSAEQKTPAQVLKEFSEIESINVFRSYEMDTESDSSTDLFPDVDTIEQLFCDHEAANYS